MTQRKRKLPPLPPGMDETDKAIITYLLDKYVEDLVQRDEDFDVVTEVEAFFAMIEQTYPVAMKDYVSAYIAQHLKVLMTGIVGKWRRAARKRTSIEHTRQGVKSGNAYKSFSGIGANRFRQVANMTLADLQFVSHRYRTTATSSLAAAEFHERLATRFNPETPESTVADYWTEDEVGEISDEIFNDEAAS